MYVYIYIYIYIHTYTCIQCIHALLCCRKLSTEVISLLLLTLPLTDAEEGFEQARESTEFLTNPLLIINC